MPSRQDHFNRVTSQARIEEAGGLARERAVLLLWYLRNEIGLDPLDAYDYITDGSDDWGVDGLYLEKEAGDSDNERLTIFQSKYLESLRQLRKSDVEGLLGAAAHFRTVTSLETMLMGPIEPALARLIGDFGLVEKVRQGRLADGRLRIDLVLVTTGYCIGPARAAADAANSATGRDAYLQIEDIDRLGPIAEAVDLRTQLNAVLEAGVKKSEVISVGKRGKRVGMAAIRADEVIGWPGIGDRSLFDLNVRRALPRNQVRNELDAAIEKPTDHP